MYRKQIVKSTNDFQGSNFTIRFIATYFDNRFIYYSWTNSICFGLRQNLSIYIWYIRKVKNDPMSFWDKTYNRNDQTEETTNRYTM